MAKLRASLIAVLIVSVLVWATAEAKSEADWTAEWCTLHSMTYDVPGDGERPSALVHETVSGRTVIADCVSTRAIVEVDFAHKYRQGIMQALEYSRLARIDPLLLLIVEKPSDCKYVLDARWLVWTTNQRLQIVTTGQSCP